MLDGAFDVSDGFVVVIDARYGTFRERECPPATGRLVAHVWSVACSIIAADFA